MHNGCVFTINHIRGEWYQWIEVEVFKLTSTPNFKLIIIPKRCDDNEPDIQETTACSFFELD